MKCEMENETKACKGSSTDGDKHGTDSTVIRSNAIVRFPRDDPVLSPYSKLELNTDLRQPPPNWLRSSPTIQVPNTWIKGEPAEISSFGMADAEILNDVDVISASENIKKLLKIPFCNDQVSLAVHRIGKTLLLDQLDLYKHLRKAPKDEREWLKDVIIRLVQEEGQKKFQGRHKTTESLQTSSLLSKFLYHSLGSGSSGSAYNVEEPESSQTPNQTTGALQHLPTQAKDQVSQFARQVLWHFEDIKMLIGTDLPIFGGGTYPAVSLRLRDMESPINVLTGLDYWLDNLMCNVPELVMCYHLDGFVQRYEMIETDKIPTLQNAQFSPKVVKDIAQNILSFINSNCTKEGHTYWLFKGQDDEVVKLYDLTSLMTRNLDCPWDNPFIVPVATLLYRVAHNMAQAREISAKERHIIVTLIDKCLELLSPYRDQHAEIVAGANCILCQMKIDDPRPGRHGNGRSDADSGPSWEDQSSLSDDDDDGGGRGEGERGEAQDIAPPPISINSLTKPPNKSWRRGRDQRAKAKVKHGMAASKEEKARQALEYVAEGLKAVRNSLPPDGADVSQMPSPPSPTRASRPLQLPPSSPARAAIATTTAIPLPDKPGSSEMVAPACETGKGAGAEDEGESHRQDGDVIADRNKGKLDGVSEEAEGENAISSLTSGKDSAGDDVTAVAPGIGSKDQPRKALEQLHGTDDRSVFGQEQQTELGKEPLSGPVCSDLVPSRTPEGSRAVARERPFPPESWQETTGLLLLEKAYRAYVVLAQGAWMEHKHGKALLCSQLAIKCLNACRPIHVADGSVCDVLMVCGDSHLLMTHEPGNRALHHDNYQDLSETDRFILQVAVIQQTCNEYEWATEFQGEVEEALEGCIRCYQACLGEPRMEDDRGFHKSVSQKLGNACNELGVFFMNASASHSSLGESLPSEFEQSLWKESYRCFESGIKAFEEVGDSTNAALLNCNTGRLMRLCAQSYSAGGSNGPSGEFSSQEKHYYVKATECYGRALTCLGNKRSHIALWDSINWELCTSYFNLACTLQDHPPVSSSSLIKIEKEVLESMSKALSLCDTEDSSSSRQPLYQYRAATIHHRLASMYHNSNRNQASHMKEKHTRSLSELHYGKAVRLFRELDRPLELLRVELERVALLEHQLEGQMGTGSRVKTLESALGIILDCASFIPQLERMTYKLVPSTKPPSHQETEAPSHQETEAPSHQETEPTSHQETEPPTHQETQPPSHQETEPPSHQETEPPSHQENEPPSHQETEPPLHQESLQQERDGSQRENATSQGGGSPGRNKQGSIVAARWEECLDRKDVQSPAGNSMDEEGTRIDEGDRNAVETSLECEDKEKCGAERGGGGGGEVSGGHFSGLGDKGKKNRHGNTEDTSGACGGESESRESDQSGDGNVKNEGARSGGERMGVEGEEEAGSSSSDVNEVNRLLTIFESRLQFILLNLVKLLGTNKKRSQERALSLYKQMYAASLGRSHSAGDREEASLGCRLQDIQQISTAKR